MNDHRIATIFLMRSVQLHIEEFHSNQNVISFFIYPTKVYYWTVVLKLTLPLEPHNDVAKTLNVCFNSLGLNNFVLLVLAGTNLHWMAKCQ